MKMMDELIPFFIDGRAVEAPRGAYLLPVAMEAGFEIPHLCYHPSVKPYGACRLCLVEVKHKGRTRLTTACDFPVLPEIEVTTRSERVSRNRRVVLEMLLARCPDVPSIRRMAAGYGVTETRLVRRNEDCILCGLCVRVCSEVIGAGAIGFVNRGASKDVRSPFERDPDGCIGCGACASVCPTGCIQVERAEGYTRIERWHTERRMVFCRICGAIVGTESQIEHLAGRFALDPFILSTCSGCRQAYYASKVKSEGHM